MIECKISEINVDFLKDNSFGAPIIICTHSQRIYQRIINAGYSIISINALLSKELLQLPVNERPSKIELILNKFLLENTQVAITDFEMLFDPRYSIDVLKYFCEKARKINVVVLWPGNYSDHRLTYAEQGDLDYHEYNCNLYQIRVAI